MQDLCIPFGKHKGTPVEQVPLDYLKWLHKNVKLKGGLKRAVELIVTGVRSPQKPVSSEWIGPDVPYSDDCPFDLPGEPQRPPLVILDTPGDDEIADVADDLDAEFLAIVRQ